jgi:hypothetical protein
MRLMRPDIVTAAVLDARLRASDSATEVIGDLFGRPVRIHRLTCDAPSLGLSQHACLRPTADQPAVHRRVTLLADGMTVSEADLWYVPARLWPGMAATLSATDTPFGIVVRPMRPYRETLATRFCDPHERYALEHEAVLRDSDGAAIALVMERYLKLSQGRPGALPLDPR